MLRTTGADISAEIEGFASGFEEGALELVSPDNTFEKIGFTTEKIAEFFVPGNFVKGATKKIAAQHMPRLLESIARIGLNTAAPTVVSIAQQGEINKEVRQTAMYAGVFSTVSEGIRVLSTTPAGQNLIKWLTEKLPGRRLNGIVRPSTKEFDFSKNPGQTVSKEGIVANTRGELLTKIGSRKQEVGSQIDDVLDKASNSDTSAAFVDDALTKVSKSDTSAALGYVDRITQFQKNMGANRDFGGTNSDLIRVLKKDIIDNLSPKGIGANDFKISQEIIDKISALDDTAFSSVDDLSKAVKDIIGQGGQTRMDVLNNILNPINKAKEQAIRTGDKALFSRLSDLEQSLTKNFTKNFTVIGDKNLSSLAPKEVQSLKIQVGKDTIWTGQAFDKALNKVRVAIYRNLDSALDKVAPGIDGLNQRYAGLLTAEKALERSNRIVQRNVEIGLRATGVGGVVGGISLVKGDSGPTSILKGVLGAAAFQLLGSTAVQTRTANFLTKLTPANQIQFVNIVKNIVLGAKASNNEDK